MDHANQFSIRQYEILRTNKYDDMIENRAYLLSKHLHKEDEKYKTPTDKVEALSILFIFSKNPCSIQTVTVWSWQIKIVT